MNTLYPELIEEDDEATFSNNLFKLSNLSNNITVDLIIISSFSYIPTVSITKSKLLLTNIRCASSSSQFFFAEANCSATVDPDAWADADRD